MVAYSFKKRFVDPILAGTKRQTIRATGLRRHARPNEEIQLYTAMRTKKCTLIGRATCAAAPDIAIHFCENLDVVMIRDEKPFSDIAALDRFAASDGFKSWDELLKFWDEEHDGIVTKRLRFAGVLVRWGALL